MSEPPLKHLELPMIRLLESAAKVAASLAALCYGVGMLTINIYLYELGALDVSLLRVRYIFAGALTSSFLILFTGMPWLGFYVYDSIQIKRIRLPQKLNRFRAAVSLTCSFGVSIIPALLILLTLQDHAVTIRDYLHWTIGFYFWTLLLGLSIKRGIDASQYEARINLVKRDGSPAPYIGLCILSAVLLSLFSISQFAATFFPAVPSQFGGGAPTTARILFLEDEALTAEAIGVPLQENSHSSEPLKLIVETNDSYVVQPQGQSVVIIQKKLVGAVHISGK